MSERPIIVFDVNETLLDLDTISPTFMRIFDDPAALRLWFAGLITYSEALTLAGVYVPFTDIGSAVLRMLAATRGIAISAADGAELTDRFASMPVHPEAPAALRRLRDHGFRLFTLTDNTLEISGRQLENAGVIDLFEHRFSVDETVHRHKPAPDAYHSVAGELGIDPGHICLIACHAWDTLGAVAAGWQAGLILREGNAPMDVGPQPNYIGDDLDAIADQLIERYLGRYTQQEDMMPVTRISIREGKPPQYKQALMDEIYAAMRETVAIKDGDRFMAIAEHGEHEFAYGPFLGIDRGDDLVQIQVFWAPGKTVDAKLAMYRKIVERLGANPGVRPEDVLISVVATAAENWSFGNGETQFYKPRERQGAPA